MTTPVRSRYRRVLLAVAGTAAALTAAACSSSSSSAWSSPTGSSSSGSGSGTTTNVSSVTLNIGDQKGTGAEALLQASGLISKLPFKANWTDFTSGPPMLQAMGAGSVDIGGVGDAPPVFAASGGEQVAIVGARTTPGAAAAIVVPKNSPITSISQLKGKKIAVAQGSSGDYHLLTVLNKAGLTTKQVTLEYLQPAEALAAFTSGHVDVWDVWSPYIERAVGQDSARILERRRLRLPLLVRGRVARRAERSGQGRRDPRLPHDSQPGLRLVRDPHRHLGEAVGRRHRPAELHHAEGVAGRRE